ncbi:MAG: transporter substrate-binding domain-containing protein [Alphaproteobacteria bacterium]|nr:MAG: transporter substrate-binding domain-containing protein [Alphaproteobacteria bacterium]
MKNIVVSALIALIVSLFAVHFSKQSAEVKETVLERIERTKTLRCGYNIEPPMNMVDANTGKVYGAIPDIVEKIAEYMNWKVEWTEQVPWSDLVVGLQANRYDLACVGKWVFIPQVRGGQFSQPLYFAKVHGYGRADESRFDDTLSTLNDPKFTIASIDGEINYYISRNKFPKAKRLEMPGIANPGELQLSVINNKADVTFLAKFSADDYIKTNPGKIKQLTKQPVAFFDTALMFKGGEAAFGGALDAALRQMHGDGFIAATLDKWKVPADSIARVKLPVD